MGMFQNCNNFSVQKSENWTRKDFLQVLCRKGNRPEGQDYEIVIIRLADL